MAKNAGDVLLEQAFKKPALLKANAKEEVKCEDFSNILYRWMIQIGRGKSAITKMQPPQNNPGAAAANPEPARPSLSGSKGMSAAKFWETMKMSKVGQVKLPLTIRKIQEPQEIRRRLRQSLPHLRARVGVRLLPARLLVEKTKRKINTLV
eukprot:TRINITY_DN3571_c0_g2_i1.p1 TRINITY_DN3571_c0_g2~~TRINITY_DN3571_c0_g2_i1.p1  ORF type:complete len:151 (+),score=20.81 TRINITY_DN3571_c0_g2_i1:1315-1767(+)